MPRYMYEAGEERFVWLDEDGERTSPFHKTPETAYAYRRMQRAYFTGRRVLVGGGRRSFELEGSGKLCHTLTKVRLEMVPIDMSADDAAAIAALEHLESRR